MSQYVCGAKQSVGGEGRGRKIFFLQAKDIDYSCTAGLGWAADAQHTAVSSVVFARFLGSVLRANLAQCVAMSPTTSGSYHYKQACIIDMSFFFFSLFSFPLSSRVRMVRGLLLLQQMPDQ